MGECSEENEQQSLYSPGTVGDEEPLARFIWRDDHLAEDGQLAPAAFSVKEFLDDSRGGLSVARLDYMTADEIQRPAALLGPERAKMVKGRAVAETTVVRAIRKEGLRVFCVVDDGKPNCHAHAATRLAEKRCMSRSAVRRVRAQLMRTFSFQSTI